MVRVVCVIPARLSSTRLPQKPLLDICGKTMLERTYNRAIEVFKPKDVFIATESNSIVKQAKSFGANVLLTSNSCLTGTDRVAEITDKIKADYYVNLQGDEPIMPLANIDSIYKAAKQNNGAIINGFAKIENSEEFYSNMIPKVVINNNKELLYMSRSPVPGNKNGKFCSALKQICVYAFTSDHLKNFRMTGKKSLNEEIEDIEILRFLDNGYKVSMIEMSANTVAVDTIEDYMRVELIIKNQGEDLVEYDVG